MTCSWLLENLISDFIFWGILSGVGFFWFYLSKKRKLISFFGVKNSRQLTIYLSKIGIIPFGSVGVNYQKFSFEGDAVSHREMQCANKIKNLFTFLIPELGESVKFIGNLFYSDVSVEITASPVNELEIKKKSSIIAIGSPAYNVASKYIENLNSNIVTIKFGNARLADIQEIDSFCRSTALGSDSDPGVYTGGTATIYPQPQKTTSEKPEYEMKPAEISIDYMNPIKDNTNGFIERIVDRENDRVLFYLAGLSEQATIGAINYLENNWLQLFKKYKADKSFLIMLKTDRDEILFEKELK